MVTVRVQNEAHSTHKRQKITNHTLGNGSQINMEYMVPEANPISQKDKADKDNEDNHIFTILLIPIM